MLTAHPLKATTYYSRYIYLMWWEKASNRIALKAYTYIILLFRAGFRYWLDGGADRFFRVCYAFL